MSCNPIPPNPPEGKSHADMVADMLTPDLSRAQTIGDFRLTQWDEFAKEVLSVCGRWKDNSSLPIIYKDNLNLSELAIPGPDKYESIVRAMSILANLWESTFPEEQAIRHMHNFLASVRNHIETYTIPRYATGCQYSDPLSRFTLADVDTQLTKYVTRYGRMERGDERVLDIMKMAHYYQVGWSLWSKKPEENPAEPQTRLLEEDTAKSLNILWNRVRNLEYVTSSRDNDLIKLINKIIDSICALERHVSALESRPTLTEAQKQIIDFNTPMDI